ncbi:phosphoribosylanthranilate isomerase [Legionella dresdenensis]|uniref:N-(5'-phosphoribosyl)anthranilate isomerase n=1 Tax=Legionella dresdenensis TaxID=450200 RepID=A0ABV8CDR6_9GAMM
MEAQRVRIKMCGMTRRQDIDYAIALGADAIGLIFYPKSRRYVTVEQAKILLREIPPLVNIVAVAVDPEPDDLKRLINELPIDTIQFHGNEKVEFCQRFGRPYIKAVSARNSQLITAAMDKFQTASAILVDTPSAEYGGSGQAFDWQIIPERRTRPLIIAGGLNPQNCIAAVKLNPYALDVCSGIEQSPGIKDHHKMKQFVDVLRGKHD